MILKQIKRLQPRQFFKLLKLFALRPHHVFPTLKATQKTMQISDTLFAKAHHHNGFANAFRHALWNILLCKHLHRKNKDKVKTAQQADKITMLHEELFQNIERDKIMDIHNNRVGQHLFIQQADLSVQEWINLLLEKENSAIKYTAQLDLKKKKDTLIYLS